MSDTFLSERCKHTSAIVLLNGLVIFESIFMLVRSTNPFFGGMAKPTPGFVFFMILQIALLGAGVLLTVGTCACKEKLIRGNRVLFWVVGLVNVVYGVVFCVENKFEGGLTFLFGALLSLMGELLCRRFLLTLSHEQLPTQSPGFSSHKNPRAKRNSMYT